MSEFNPAKRGFIAITQKAKRGFSLVAGCYSTLSITVGTVESITRDGTVKTVAPAGDTAAKLTKRDWDEVIILDPAKLADPAGFLAECKARQDANPETWRPFESLDDVRETARKYR
ncbi:hypothetical protein [Rhizobium phage RHph_X2_30]|nr:hypothetical protein [Rhizobium phage RHph_X2_30]